jgi:hypothetical protein
MEKLLLLITNEIFKQGRVPKTLKAGLLTPIFKNKGLKTQATNNRVIAVLPVISKIVEGIIKVRIQCVLSLGHGSQLIVLYLLI